MTEKFTAHPRLQAMLDQRLTDERLARVLLRRQQLYLWLAAGASLATGAALSWFAHDVRWLVRAGNLITAFSIVHALVAIQNDWLWSLLNERVAEVPADDEAAVNPMAGISAAMQRQFAVHHLLVAALGTIIAGFGDLLPI